MSSTEEIDSDFEDYGESDSDNKSTLSSEIYDKVIDRKSLYSDGSHTTLDAYEYNPHKQRVNNPKQRVNNPKQCVDKDVLSWLKLANPDKLREGIVLDDTDELIDIDYDVTAYFENLQQGDPVIFKAVIDAISVLNTDDKVIRCISSIDVKIAIFHLLDQDRFNKHLLTGQLSNDIMEKLDLGKIYECYLNCIESPKLMEKFCHISHVAFSRLAVAGMIEVYDPENENCMLNVFIRHAKKNFEYDGRTHARPSEEKFLMNFDDDGRMSMRPSEEKFCRNFDDDGRRSSEEFKGFDDDDVCLDTLRTLLMYAETLPKPNTFRCCPPDMYNVICEFYFNRCQMLELENNVKGKLVCEDVEAQDQVVINV
jgi:hypothetical protein